MFNLCLVDLPKLHRIDGEVRLYETPTGEKYPSVTTVIGAASDKSGLIEWRKRVGEEEATRVSRRATVRGTGLHSMWEKIVLNEEFDRDEYKRTNITNYHMFKQVEDVLIENVDNIKCSEGSLFSHKLRVAGSVDLIADYKGKPSIIDFKTSGKTKRKEWITDYFLQTTLYSYMYWEMMKEMHSQLVVIIAVEESNEAQVFVDNASKWIDRARSICDQFHSS